jgi:4-amino-4-deoxy-L-arabinose transferase-like glycosyltransferase
MHAKGFSPPLVPAASWLDAETKDDAPLGPGFLLMITLLGLFLRFYALTSQSLWVDEIMSWSAIRPGAGLHFVEQIRDAIQGPLYLAITWPLLRLQDSALMLRLPSAFAGVLTVPLFALTAERLFGGRAARLAGFLLVVSPFHVWYSQEGRGYALLILFSVAMGYLMLRMICDGLNLRSAVLFAACSAAAVWSNMSGLFLWGAMGLGVLFARRPASGREWGLWVIAFGGGLLAVVPWILKAAGIWAVDRMVVGNPTGQALRGETTFTPIALPYSVFTFIFGYSLGPSLRQLHHADKVAAIKPYFPVLVAAMVPVGAGLLAGLGRLRRPSWILVVWILIPVLALVFLAVRNVKPWNPRYISVVFPWVLALLAYGLVRLPRIIGLVSTALLLGLCLFSLGNYFWDGNYAKADVRGAVKWITAAETEIDPVPEPVLVPVVTNVFNYYYRGPREILAAFDQPTLQGAAQADQFLAEVLAGRDRLLYLEARQWFFDPHGVLPAALARHGHLRVEMEAPGVKVYSWQRPSTPEVADEH